MRDREDGRLIKIGSNSGCTAYSIILHYNTFGYIYTYMYIQSHSHAGTIFRNETTINKRTQLIGQINLLQVPSTLRHPGDT